MNSQNANSTQRLSLSDHDLILLEVDDEDGVWTDCKKSYQAVVVSYLLKLRLLFLRKGRFTSQPEGD